MILLATDFVVEALPAFDQAGRDVIPGLLPRGLVHHQHTLRRQQRLHVLQRLIQIVRRMQHIRRDDHVVTVAGITLRVRVLLDVEQAIAHERIRL